MMDMSKLFASCQLPASCGSTSRMANQKLAELMWHGKYRFMKVFLNSSRRELPIIKYSSWWKHLWGKPPHGNPIWICCVGVFQESPSSLLFLFWDISELWGDRKCPRKTCSCAAHKRRPLQQHLVSKRFRCDLICVGISAHPSLNWSVVTKDLFFAV